MTVIVAWLENDQPTMAGDSRVCTGHAFCTDDDPKVYRLGAVGGRSGLLFGAAGDSGACEKLRRAFRGLYGEPTRDAFVDALLSADAGDGVEFLLAVWGRIYYGDGSGSLLAVNGPLAAVGAGAGYVLGYLAAGGNTPLAMVQRVSSAMRSCYEAMPDSCGGRVDMVKLGEL